MEYNPTKCSQSTLHAWTVNSVNRLVKNSKHITAITSPPKPEPPPITSNQSKIPNLLICITNTRLLACDADE